MRLRNLSLPFSSPRLATHLCLLIGPRQLLNLPNSSLGKVVSVEQLHILVVSLLPSERVVPDVENELKVVDPAVVESSGLVNYIEPVPGEIGLSERLQGPSV